MRFLKLFIVFLQILFVLAPPIMVLIGVIEYVQINNLNEEQQGLLVAGFILMLMSPFMFILFSKNISISLKLVYVGLVIILLSGVAIVLSFALISYGGMFMVNNVTFKPLLKKINRDLEIKDKVKEAIAIQTALRKGEQNEVI